jgi:hypothetical protein
MLLRENESEMAIIFTFPLYLFNVKIKLKNTIQKINPFGIFIVHQNSTFGPSDPAGQ